MFRRWPFAREPQVIRAGKSIFSGYCTLSKFFHQTSSFFAHHRSKQVPCRFSKLKDKKEAYVLWRTKKKNWTFSLRLLFFSLSSLSFSFPLYLYTALTTFAFRQRAERRLNRIMSLGPIRLLATRDKLFMYPGQPDV